MTTMNSNPFRLPVLALAAALALPALAGAATQPAGGEHPYQIRVRTLMKPRVVMGLMGRGYLGVQLLDITEELRDFYGAPQDAGILVSRVTEDSPAAAAGFKVGDVITEVAGEPTRNSRDVMRAVGGLEPEDDVAVEVVRAGAPLTLNATLGEREGSIWFSGGFDMPEFEEFHFEMPDLPESMMGDGETREAVRQAIEQARERMSSIDFEGLTERLTQAEARLRELEKKLAERQEE